MGAEMRDREEIAEGQVWRKAIPEGRDRVQSRVLVWVVGALLLLETVIVLQQVYFLWGTDHARDLIGIAKIVGISFAFACLVRMLRAATLAGSFAGGMICLLLLSGTSTSQYSVVRSGLAPLALLFVLTFLSTRAGRKLKAEAGLAERRKGRSAAQVIANLSIAAMSVSTLGFEIVTGGGVCCGGGYYRMWVFPTTMMMCLAALVEATADTVSSEIGQAFGGRPVMLLSLKRVEVGTDGAVTLLGSGAGILAGAMVAAVGMWGLRLSILEAGIALGAGICGLFFDSLLGATLERRGWLGNDLVNFASTVFAAGVAGLIYRLWAF
jgi:uncharacterized protein (TIGR00297 family)